MKSIGHPTMQSFCKRGSFPEIYGFDFGEVGIYAVYEEESRTLLLQLGDKFLRLKNEETN